MKANSKAATQQRGFTITQMVITISIIAVVSTFGVLGIRTARAEFRLQSAARLFASYIEKARADSIRRQAISGNESGVEIFGEGTTNYAITMDFGSGVVETRTFQLEPGIEFGTAAKKISFDWRGRLTEPCTFTKSCVFQIHSVYLQQNLPVDVSGSGDITVGEQRFPDRLIPEVAISEVTNDVDNSTPIPTPTPEGTPAVEESPSPEENPDATPTPTPTATATPTPTPNGNGNGNDGDNGNGNGNPTPTPTPSASPSPEIPQCVSVISPSSLFLSQSDVNNLTGTATVTMTNASGVRILTASQAGNGNSLTVGLSLQRIDGSGSSVITVTTKPGAGNRGEFIVQVAADPACGSAPQLKVTVSN
jgi:type II secretory pathway pseudopilin PulG